MRWPLIVLPVLSVLLSAVLAFADDDPAPTAKPDEPAPRLAELQKHVEHLAGAELMGRGAWEDRERAAEYVAKQFADAGLMPLPGMASMFLDHDGASDAKHVRNVVAWLPGTKAGTTKAAPGEYVIVSAHYDHLGARRTPDPEDPEAEPALQVFHGADDNASGVAALIEMAYLLVSREPTCGKLDRSVVFVAFDLEEVRGGIGSHAYVEASPLPLDQLKAFVTMDQLGRSVADVVPGALFTMGIERCRELRKVVDDLGAPGNGRLLPLGVDFQPGYSDYVPFLAKSIPYVFVTSGACADWHQTTDIADRIGWAHLEARTAWCRDLAVAIADGEKTFTWLGEPEPHPRELEILRETVIDVQAHAQERGLPAAAAFGLGGFRAQLDQVLEDGEVTADERARMVRMAISLFQLASQLQGAR